MSFSEMWENERGGVALWAPVALGGGVWAFFRAPVEPAITVLWVCGGLGAGLLAIGLPWRRAGEAARLAVIGAGLALLGFSAAGARAHLVAAPVLDSVYSGAVEGRVRGISASHSGAPRVLLDQVVLGGVAPDATPARVRITFPAGAAEGLVPGARVRVHARLAPPSGPVEPGGFDFRRAAWFARLGAVGYARQAPVATAPPAADAGWWIRLDRLRARISAHLRAALPGERGAVAAALTTGDRSGVSPQTQQALRDSNLAHLLAISGLHMGLLTGLAFGLTRFCLAAAPRISLAWPVKKMAVLAALTAGAAYLGLSGATVSTQRAFVMTAVAFAAVLIDRPAITLRALAAAALGILLLRPESLMEAGFQLSFAATCALVAVYDGLRGQWGGAFVQRGWVMRGAAFIAALALTSLIAGAATAPFAAFHFNRATSYGLIANVAAIPAMGLWIMPSAIVSVILAPFGLEGIGLDMMGRGIGYVIGVARMVASWRGAAHAVPAAGEAALAAIALGGLILCLGRTWLRLGGLPLLALGAILWAGATRPDVLIAPHGLLIGVMGPEGRALDLGDRQSYAADTWLRRDGDGTKRKEAAARPGIERGRGWLYADLPNGWRLEADFRRHPSPDALNALCMARVLIVTPFSSVKPEGPCRTLSKPDLTEAGAIAIYARGRDLRLETTRGRGGRRLWTGGDQ